MKTQLHKVSAFCEGSLEGNPAGVCLNSKGASAEAMLAMAKNLGFSETAFPVKKGDHWSLRWFTPSTEVKLCGHATLATAWLLWEENLVDRREVIKFETLSGVLEARRVGDWIELYFPPAPFEKKDLPKPLSALGDRIKNCGTYGEDWLFEMLGQEDILALDPDSPFMSEVEARGLCFTARAEKEGFDIVSRFFGPLSGIPEDPVTGSAHCGLGPYWMKRLNKEELIAWQASPRGGEIKIRMEGDKIVLAGKARRMETATEIDL